MVVFTPLSLKTFVWDLLWHRSSDFESSDYLMLTRDLQFMTYKVTVYMHWSSFCSEEIRVTPEERLVVLKFLTSCSNQKLNFIAYMFRQYFLSSKFSQICSPLYRILISSRLSVEYHFVYTLANTFKYSDAALLNIHLLHTMVCLVSSYYLQSYGINNKILTCHTATLYHNRILSLKFPSFCMLISSTLSTDPMIRIVISNLFICQTLSKQHYKSMR